ncbi:MAG: hypothetical protein ACREV4_01580 [Gammaproteobacteria bacterium]
MNSARLAAIPIDHVVAEMAAIPLASEAALRFAVIELDPELKGNSSALWRAAERHTLGSFPAFSIDEAVAIRDALWFGGAASRPVPLHVYLGRLARQFLEARGPIAAPALDTAPHARGPSDLEPRAARARAAWRWLSFALPPDLLLAALSDPRRSPVDIALLAPTLSQQLADRGYAEVHLHIGAALEFPLMWLSALWAVARPGTKEGAFQSPGAALNEGRDLAPWLLRAAIARYVLAAYLAAGARDLEAYLKHVVSTTIVTMLGVGAYAWAKRSLDDLKLGSLTGSGGAAFSQLQSLYVQLGGGPTWQPFPSALNQVHRADPIGVFFPAPSSGGPTPEMRFITEGLRYLRSAPADRTFAVLFWQIVRIRVLFYRHVTQRPMTPGLQWFIRFYGRIKPGRRPLSKRLLTEAAASIGGHGAGLRSLEIRTAPDAHRSALLHFVRDIDLAAQALHHHKPASSGSNPLSDLEVGVVLHFNKDRGGKAKEGSPTAHGCLGHADPSCRYGKPPSGNPSGFRYAQFYNFKRNEALSFAWVLWHFPLSLELLRGIDVCTDELGVPTWVLAPLFRYVRETGDATSQVLRQRYGKAVPGLRTTAHAGEDFVHLLTGLRNVDEAVRRLGLREGDRIGHGLALGVEPREWAERAGRIPMAREERLFDLAWEWAWYAHESIDPPSGRAPMLEREIARLSKEVFDASVSPFDFEMFVDLLYNERWLSLTAFPNGLARRRGRLDRPVPVPERYLRDPAVFMQGREIEWVDPSLEGEVLVLLQAGIRQKLGQRGIAVEVNPSSNLLIGDLSDLTRHPLWRLRPPRSSGDAPPVSVCIGSDDPLTFATKLPQEYQLLHDALVLAGLSEAEAACWLDETRETGLRNRFTLPRRLGFATAGTPLEKPSIKPILNLEISPVAWPP